MTLAKTMPTTMYFEQFYLDACPCFLSVRAEGEGGGGRSPARRRSYCRRPSNTGLRIRAPFLRLICMRTSFPVIGNGSAYGRANLHRCPSGGNLSARGTTEWLRAAGLAGENQPSSKLRAHSRERLSGCDRRRKSPEPWAVLTGDTLFIGDVGRPDLSTRHTPAQLAGFFMTACTTSSWLLPTTWWCIRRTGPGRFVGVTCARNAPDDWDREAHQHCTRDPQPRRICATVDHQPAVLARIFSEGCRDQPGRSGAARRPCRSCHAFRPGR